MSARRWLIPGSVVVFMLVALVLSLAIPETGETFGFIALLVGQFTAGIVAFRRTAKLEPRERTVWRLFGTAVLLAGTGVFLFGLWSLLVGDPPAFGPLDSFFLAAYALFVIAIVRLTRIDAGGAHWLTTILDGLVGGIALVALVWTAFLHQLFEIRMASGVEAVIGLSYPIFDIAIVVGVMVMVIRRSNYHFDVRLLAIALGMSIQVLSDFIYFSSGVGRTFAEAQPSWPLLLLAAIFLLLAAAVADITPARREYPERSTPIWALMWPYLLAGVLLATHVVRYRSIVRDTDGVLLLDALILIGALIFLRQVFEIYKNRQRVEVQRSELVASVSHELRTPLTAIVGYLSLLDDSGEEFPPEARHEMVSEATAEARHMSRLVNDLVMLARGGSSSLPLQITEVRLSDIVSTSIRNVEASGTRIDERTEDDVTVRVDADRLQQALTNLVSNAVRYGGDHVVVHTHVDDRDLVVEVHDSGAGVPTRYESLIWQRFERGAHRLNAATPGLGIGLAIVRTVAESHGGTAHYRESERLGGACFALTIPGCVVGALIREREVSYST